MASTIIVVALKLVAAALSGSIAVLSEALQSTLDVAMSIAALWAIRVAARPPDKEHPYGHGKAELLLSAFQMVMVILTAGVIAWQAALRLKTPQAIQPDWGLVAMGYAAVANTVVATYLRRTSRRVSSAALAGEAQHLMGDTLASLGVLGGLVAYSVTQWKPVDPLMAILFTVIGAVFAVRQLQKVLHPLMDGSLPPQEIAILEEVLRVHPETRGFHKIQTREDGSRRFVTLHLMLDDNLTFVQAHDTAEMIEGELSRALHGASVTIHYEPCEAETEHQLREHKGAGVTPRDPVP